jgi:hypothetical protein
LEKPIDQIFDYPTFDANGGIPLAVLNTPGTGGGTAPVLPPPYVPQIPNNPMTIHLIGEASDLEFLEDNVSKGFGKTIDVVYNSALQFNGPKTYTANLNNGKVLSKFVVAIKKLGVGTFAMDGIGVTEYKLVNDNWEEQTTQNFNFGSIALRFKSSIVAQAKPQPDIKTVKTVTTNPNPNSQLEIAFSSNLPNEVKDSLSLSYQIVYGTTIIDSGVVGISSNIFKEFSNEIINNSIVNFEVRGNLPDGIGIDGIYSGIKSQFNGDFSRLNKVPYAFNVPASQLRNSFLVIVDAAKEVKYAEPKITLGGTKYTINVKESDTEKAVIIPFNTDQADNVIVYIDENTTLRVPASDKQVTLYFQKDFKEVYGSKKIIFVAEGDKYGTGQKAETIITFVSINDYPSITETTAPDVFDIPSFSDYNIDYEITYSTFSATSVDAWLKLKDGSRVGIFSNFPPNGKLKINIKTLREKYSKWVGSDNITIILKPYNRSGAENLIGNEYEVVTKLVMPTLELNEEIISKALFDSFAQSLQVIEPELDSKHLTHLANFGNNEQIIVSSWEVDKWTLSKKSEDSLGNTFVKPADEIESYILKLYSPLNANIVNNSTLWVTKLMSNPLIETIVLNEQDNLSCPPLKGPNFGIDVDYIKGQSTNFESLDNLILSSSTTSNQLVQTYLSSSLVDTSNLNIEYVSGSTYLWNNFTHFSSAKERVDNFVYKVQLIESYEEAIQNAQTASWNASLTSKQQVEKYQIKTNQLLQGFDGFENFLYTSSSLYTTNNSTSITWPYNGNTRIFSTNTIVRDNWYPNIIALATNYDNNNSNWVQNNIPQYIVNNGDNESLLLFFSMIGHHFDNIYYHTKAIEKSRGLGYKSKDGISDKLLFDTLKSFGWDAHNLATDEKLWKYVFGMDSEGTTQETNPAKQRTYEVWRRIVNNLPYLLKHKGTRRGVYALLSCYGIPSSNLSILEFGGPEVTETTKSKLVMDNITTALKFTSGSSIQMGWQNTNKNRKPDTIELFVKPTTAGNYNVVTGVESSLAINISGSIGSKYGVVKIGTTTGEYVTSSLLPIFNDKFFGIKASREVSGSYHNFELSVRQSEKERTIFEETKTVSIDNTISVWDNGSTLQLGSGFIGSIDEFRLWSTPLDKERFYEHVSFPEMINGNSVSSSTDDLHFRLDFEYPKNLAVSQSLINVDTNIVYPLIQINPSSSLQITRNILEETGSIGNNVILSTNVSASFIATAVGFTSVTSYPYQFEAIDRSVVLEIPDMGATRYSTNKVRFESQELVSDLSSKHRSTKKAFDQSPTDSNRVGLFFSPTKELNMDIAKSLGGINLDNYIGDPSDKYKSNYSRLDSLRNYYFQRFDGRDIYAYINLIKLYEKSMFEDIKKMLPARVKASTGLLIEPHILERSKVQHKKPSGDEYQQEVNISYGDTTILTSEDFQKEVTLDTTLNKITSENNQYYGLIESASIDKVIAENYQYDGLYNYVDNTNVQSEYYQKEVNIDAGLGEPTILTEIDVYGLNTIVGQSDYETIGFGIYAEHGHAIRTYFNKEGRRVKERIKIDLIKEQKSRDIVKFKTSINGKGDPRDGMILTSSVYYETSLNIQPYSGSKVINAGTGSIVEVTPLHGYLPTHYRNTSDLTKGLENSFYRGSKNTAATTLDGTPPVETFTSNPNTLKVNKAGRDASEPILEVD